MLFTLRLWVIALAALSFAYIPESTVATDLLAAQSLATLIGSIQSGSLGKYLSTRGVKQSCGIGKAIARREYSTLSNNEKLAYTKAVKCLMASPSKISPGLAPGAKSRYDDFVATHVNQTGFIHFTGNFFHWHRYYIWAFEAALRNECGYQGWLPYWNWAKSSKDPLNSPYFDGSPYSQGGNGIWAPHNCTRPAPEGPYCIPVVQGRGGGCVQTGPYAGIPTNISATGPSLVAPDAPIPGPFLGYQPRCIRRDISVDLSQRFGNEAHTFYILTAPIFQGSSIGPFQAYFEGGSWTYPQGTIPGADWDIGQHGTGHFTFAGDPGGDIFNSPGDPMFWLLHANVDRIWWIWQNQKPIERAFMINGTRTILNTPPSDNATIEDLLVLDYVTPKGAPASAIKHHVSSMAGPYCYLYL
ncbi:Di-copper centre-containing protein [Thozetella sp. PMI_491]|nr:Di-copper centre-containing protein [Thozetella sp. PMI_491]